MSYRGRYGFQALANQMPGTTPRWGPHMGIPKPTNLPCECGTRMTREDIRDMMHGEVLKCAFCSSLIWFDELSWVHPGDMTYHYIRWGEDPDNWIRISVWLQEYFLSSPKEYDTSVKNPLPFNQV